MVCPSISGPSEELFTHLMEEQALKSLPHHLAEFRRLAYLGLDR